MACCCGDNRARFERELARLRGCRFQRLLVIGTPSEIEAHQYRGQIAPAAVMGSLAAWEVRFNVPVVFSPSPAAAALRVERWAHYYARELHQSANALRRAADDDLTTGWFTMLRQAPTP